MMVYQPTINAHIVDAAGVFLKSCATRPLPGPGVDDHDADQVDLCEGGVPAGGRFHPAPASDIVRRPWHAPPAGVHVATRCVR